MTLRTAARAVPLVIASVALALSRDAVSVSCFTAVLWCLLLALARSTVLRVLKAVLLFNAVYLLSSLLVQLLVMGSAELPATALVSLKLASLSLASIATSSVVYPLLVRRACRRRSVLTLLVAIRSVAESYAALRDALDAVRLNYGARGRGPSLGTTRAVLEILPVLVFDTVVRRFESAITMVPRAGCGGQRQ